MRKALGMIKLDVISIDGSKIRAGTSAKKTKDKEGYKKWEQTLDEQIKRY